MHHYRIHSNIPTLVEKQVLITQVTLPWPHKDQPASRIL